MATKNNGKAIASKSKIVTLKATMESATDYATKAAAEFIRQEGVAFRANVSFLAVTWVLGDALAQLRPMCAATKPTKAKPVSWVEKLVEIGFAKADDDASIAAAQRRAHRAMAVRKGHKSPEALAEWAADRMADGLPVTMEIAGRDPVKQLGHDVEALRAKFEGGSPKPPASKKRGAQTPTTPKVDDADADADADADDVVQVSAARPASPAPANSADQSVIDMVPSVPRAFNAALTAVADLCKAGAVAELRMLYDRIGRELARHDAKAADDGAIEGEATEEPKAKPKAKSKAKRAPRKPKVNGVDHDEVRDSF